MEITWKGWAVVPRYEQRYNQCPVYGICATREEAEIKREQSYYNKGEAYVSVPVSITIQSNARSDEGAAPNNIPV